MARQVVEAAASGWTWTATKCVRVAVTYTSRGLRGACCITVLTAYGGGDLRRAFIYWNNDWCLLHEAHLGVQDSWAWSTEAVHAPDGNTFNAGAEFWDSKLWFNNAWTSWTDSVPTAVTENAPYDAYFWQNYWHWAFWKP